MLAVWLAMVATSSPAERAQFGSRQGRTFPLEDTGNEPLLLRGVRLRGGQAGQERHRVTIVTAYFKMPSKEPPEQYDKWMANMLGVNDAMVLFTSASMVPQITKLRAHAKNRTHIVSFELNGTLAATEYSQQFWQEQLNMDPEKEIHRSYQLFWVWLSKSYFVTKAIEANPFVSDIFVWSDIGAFRNNGFGQKPGWRSWVLHPEIIPTTKILMMVHETPARFYHKYYDSGTSPAASGITPWVQKQQTGCIVAGAMMAGYKDTWLEFQPHFENTVSEYAVRGYFVGEDQAVLQAACSLRPRLCTYATEKCMASHRSSWPPFDVWFGLIHMLHFGNSQCDYVAPL
jgi:hypothetical protein